MKAMGYYRLVITIVNIYHTNKYSSHINECEDNIKNINIELKAVECNDIGVIIYSQVINHNTA